MKQPDAHSDAGSLQIPESQWEDVRNSVIQSLAGSSSRSSKPAIFGAAPAPDDGGPRRPLGSAREGDTVALEVAAAEMAHSAAMLVAIERTIMALSEKGVRCPRLSDLLAEKAHTVVSGPLLSLSNQALRCKAVPQQNRHFTLLLSLSGMGADGL